MRKQLIMATAIMLMGFGSASAQNTLQRPMGAQRMGNIQDGRGMMAQDNLQLSDKQWETMDKLYIKHFRLISPEQRELMKLQRQLRAESILPTPDNKKIEQLAQHIGQKHEKLARLKSEHWQEMNAILTPAQRDSMRGMNMLPPMRGNRHCRMMMPY